MRLLLLVLFWAATGFGAPAEGSDPNSSCLLEAQKNLPYVFLIGVGHPSDWKPGSVEIFNAVNEDIRRIRARIFKEARTKNLPLLSQSYLSLNGREMGPYLEPVKAKHDQSNRVYGIESEWALALKSNFELMSHYYGDNRSKYPFLRLQQLYFLTLKYPKTKVVWDEIYTKATLYKVRDIRMAIRRFNNAIVEYERKQGLQSLVGKVSAPYRVRSYFKQRIRKPLETDKKATEIVKKMLETFHHRLVEHVNKTLNQDFRFYGPRDEKQDRLPEVLKAVEKLQALEVGRNIRKSLCLVANRPAAVVWVDRPLLEPLSKSIRKIDKRMKLETFDTFDGKERKKIIEVLSQRWSKSF